MFQESITEIVEAVGKMNCKPKEMSIVYRVADIILLKGRLKTLAEFFTHEACFIFGRKWKGLNFSESYGGLCDSERQSGNR